MAGLYIHIPFCKKRCIYCDFYSTTQQDKVERYLSALLCELALRVKELDGEPIGTIYIGGGTPSQLSIEQLSTLFSSIARYCDFSATTEITLEANPDDLSIHYLEGLRTLPINRLSMGVQSFDDEALRFLGRRHTAQQAIEAVQNAQKVGFDNISIDLMYGLPQQTTEQWQSTLNQATSLGVQHLSAYHLIYEEGTVLYQWVQSGRVFPVEEERSNDFFEQIITHLQACSFRHYEISNWALEGYQSRHNSSYWEGIPYLGLGASAHSFDGKVRRENGADIISYCTRIERGETAFSIEELSIDARYNELIITSLRTDKGLDLDRLKHSFGEYYYNYCMLQAQPYLKQSMLLLTSQNSLIIAPSAIFISDGIMSDLLVV